MTLQQFFSENPSVAIAFSGGTDSAYLLYSASKYAKRVCAYYINSEFQPQFELDDAKKLANELGTELKIIDLSVLQFEDVTDNTSLRCYYCKKKIFSSIVTAAKEDGFSVLLDGTNASDNASERPGMKALQELNVLSPLRICGLTKEQVRHLSKEAGLFTWNKPAYACLATRIRSGDKITAEDLKSTEISEKHLSSLGFSDFRIRKDGDTAKIQIKDDQLSLLMDKRLEIIVFLKQFYKNITLDLETR